MASEMAALLSESTASHEFIERISRNKGWDENKSKAIYIAEMQPDNDNVKKGKFGEVLHGAILEQFCGMAVACHRYRHSPDPNVSPPGLDIIALVPHDSGDGERIVYVETKIRLSADSGALVTALEQLAKTQSARRPPSLKSTMHVLSDANSPLFERVLRATDDEALDPHYRIGVIFEAEHWSDSQLQQIVNKRVIQLMDLGVDVVKIRSLGCLIKESYAKVGEV